MNRYVYLFICLVSLQVERIRSNLKNMDSCLGPYPYETYRMWYSLTDFITAETAERYYLVFFFSFVV